MKRERPVLPQRPGERRRPRGRGGRARCGAPRSQHRAARDGRGMVAADEQRGRRSGLLPPPRQFATTCPHVRPRREMIAADEAT